MGKLVTLPDSISCRLERQHETIFELAANFSQEQLKRRINPDKWSAFENIVHLAAYQPTFLGRMDLILTGREPEFERYVAQRDPLFYDYLEKSILQVEAGIATDRLTIIKKMSGFSEKEFNLSASHPKLGKMNLVQWTESFLLHEAHHLYTIFALTQELRKPGSQ